MVLQRDAPIPVWGWAEPGQAVQVSLGDQTRQAEADEAGRWRVDLDALTAGGPYEFSVQADDDAIALTDVLIGDVWLCSGQSNMDWKLERSEGAAEALAKTEAYPVIRMFKVARHVATEPQDDCTGRWQLNTPENAKPFSAVGYFFGMKLSDEVDVPIGLIHTAYGGTSAKAWTSTEALQAEPKLAVILEDKAQKLAAYDVSMDAWREAAKAAKADGQPAPPEPALPFYTGNRHLPAGLYNGMIHPLIPYGIKGVIWYQGEADVWHAHQYRTLLPAMINDWRARWGQGDFPFGIVQLTSYFDPKFPPSDLSWPELREAQLMTAQALPYTGLITTIDVGNPTDIHPTDKKSVGDRLAAWALGTVYNKQVVPMGPVYREAKFKDGKATIYFDHAGSGLATRDGGPVRGVVIANSAKGFRWANAEIDGDTLVVTSDRYKDPVSVRYGWADNPDWANLINKEGLPASPFRTDNWPGVTGPEE